ncbi:hypothetical protein LINPERHAP1_LOCUS395, partial [Linum perenne]
LFPLLLTAPRFEIPRTTNSDLFLSSPRTRSKKQIVNRSSTTPGIKD